MLRDKAPANAYLSGQYLPLSASAEHLGPAKALSPSSPQRSMEEGTFRPAIHTAVRLPDATLLFSVPGVGPAWGEGAWLRSIPPSLRHTEPELAGHCPGRRPLRGTPGSEAEAVPSASILDGQEKSGAERLLKAAWVAFSLSPWSSDR